MPHFSTIVASTGLQSLRALQMAFLAAGAAVVVTITFCLFIIKSLRGKTFRAWWVWSVSPPLAFTLFFVIWLILDLLS